MSQLRLVRDLDRAKWGNFVESHPNGNIFQTPWMYEVYVNIRDWEPEFLAVVNDEDTILGILLTVVQREAGGFLGKFTARAIIWGGPLIWPQGERKQTLRLLLNALDDILKKRVIYVQVRNLFDTADDKVNFINSGYEHKEHLDFLLDLSIGKDGLWEKLSSTRRNKIRKAEKEGVRVQLAGGTTEDIEKSYSVLKNVYARIKIPLAKKELFDFAYKILFPQNMLKAFLAIYENKVVGTLYLLAYREKTYVWHAGSLSVYYGKHPNDILYWEAIRWSCENGYRLFDFGGAGSREKEYGVREFKKEFGGEMVNYGRFEKAYRPYYSRIVKISLGLLQKI